MGDIQIYRLYCNIILTALCHNKDFLFHLLSTKVLRASPSTSSAMISRGLRAVLANSRAGMMLWIEEIFFSDSSTRASWNSHFAPANHHKKEIRKPTRVPGVLGALKIATKTKTIKKN